MFYPRHLTSALLEKTTDREGRGWKQTFLHSLCAGHSAKALHFTWPCFIQTTNPLGLLLLLPFFSFWRSLNIFEGHTVRGRAGIWMCVCSMPTPGKPVWAHPVIYVLAEREEKESNVGSQEDERHGCDVSLTSPQWVRLLWQSQDAKFFESPLWIDNIYFFY